MVFESPNKKNDIKVRKTDRSHNPPSKIVVRKLPPTFTEEDFKNAISPVPDNNYFFFSSADKSLGPHAYSRAYISFINVDEIFVFRDKFDGYVFVDQKGNEYPAVVEYAPFQKIPKVFTHQKKDPRCATIDEDPDYISFLESLNNPETVVLPQIENILEEIENQEKELKANNGVLKVKTPLLEYIEQRAVDRLRPGDKRRRKEFDRKRAREEEKRRRKDAKEFRKKDERGQSLSHSNAGNCTPSYRERQRRREEERQRIMDLREKEKKLRRNKELEKSGRNADDKEASNQKHHGSEETPKGETLSFKSKRYSEARKKDDREKKLREIAREAKSAEKNQKNRKSVEADGKKDNGIKLAESREENERKDKKDKTPLVEASPKEEKKPTSAEEEDTKTSAEKDGKRGSESCDEVPKDKTSPDKEKQDQEEASLVAAEEASANDKDDDADEEREDANHYRDGSSDSQKQGKKGAKDPRTGRRIRNKDRPDMQLYRPGQSRLSSRMKQSPEDGSQERDNCDSSSSSPSPVEGKEDKREDVKEAKEDGQAKEKSHKGSWSKDSYRGQYEKRGHRYRESRGGYFWESEWEKESYGKHKDDSECYEEAPSARGSSQRKGYSYHHERESKGKRSNRSKDQDSSQVKSMTFHRSTSQE